MAIRIGINGFGRIGRLALRLIAENRNIECAGINDLIPAATMAHLFKYDSTHGRFKGTVSSTEKSITINGRTIDVSSEKDPSLLPWKKLGADIVLECTGKFTSLEGASKHLSAGAKKVILSAPSKDKDTPTFVYGVNHENYKPKEQHVVSNASCTTNCLAPVAKVLHENFGIERGFMTTIHAYTNDQVVVDGPHKDLRRARAAAVSQIPTTTGAAKAVGLVLPELKGKLDGMAIRVPTPNVSIVDLVTILNKPASAEQINAALKSAAEGELKGILDYCTDPCVSVDFMGSDYASIVDALSTKAIDNMAKVLAWYDNELGFCHQMVRFMEYVGKRL